MSDPGVLDVVDLTRRLVRIPSVSGNAGDCAALLASTLPAAVVSGRNVYAVRGRGRRTLLLNSHTDTVPAGPAWTLDPHAAELRRGKLFGLGANDAKGPLAALVCAFLRSPVPSGGRLVLAATCDEETGGAGLGVLRAELPSLTAAVIGEPTGLEVCTCQRGLLRLRLVAKGKRAHAARPWQGENAIEKAARDVVRLADELELPRHPLLGPCTLQVTMIQGGVKTNVVPPECVLEIDARTIPELDNQALEKRIATLVDSELVKVSDRFVPIATPEEEPVVRAALAAAGTTAPRAFGGVSDLFHVRDLPGLVLGPGRGAQSHAADEWIEETQLRRAVDVYTALVARYLA